MASEATYRGTVYPWHRDHVGHMNIMWYVGQARKSAPFAAAIRDAALSRLAGAEPAIA